MGFGICFFLGWPIRAGFCQMMFDIEDFHGNIWEVPKVFIYNINITLPKTNIAPENKPLEKEIPIGNHDILMTPSLLMVQVITL